MFLEMDELLFQKKSQYRDFIMFSRAVVVVKNS